MTKARHTVKSFIQPVHHFRDECLKDLRPPPEHVTIFDEAQRAWDRHKTADFMRRKRGLAVFHQSEPEFLVACMDRHPDWATIVCLIGGGQEINTGEAGISEWIHALCTTYPHWQVHLSQSLADTEYSAQAALSQLKGRPGVHFNEDMHLSTSMRSFRSERVAEFVKFVLELDAERAAEAYRGVSAKFPIVLTRNIDTARNWLRSHARGSERFGMIVSSQAQRLKPHAIDVRAPVDPVHWFLNDRSDIRSSYYLEDVATEFQVQGLELDWTCVVWDADLRVGDHGWSHHSFVGDRWQRIKMADRQAYLKNAYRVLLTRARQGMVIVVPDGSSEDHTRQAAFYDGTFNYLRSLGITAI